MKRKSGSLAPVRVRGLLFVLVFILATTAFAQTNISQSSWASWYPRVAIDGQGNINVVWAEIYGSGNGDLFFSRMDKGTGVWSTPVNLSESGMVWSDTLMVCSVAVDDSDNVYVLWSAQSAVMLRVRSSSGDWSGVTQVASGSGLDGPRIAVTGGGDIFCVWWTGAGTVVTRARVGGGWESDVQVSDGGRRSKFPDIGVGSGQALACWVEKSGDIYQAAYTVRGTGSGSGWSSSARVSSSSYSQQHPVVEYIDSTPHIVMTPVTDPNRIVWHCAWTGSGFGSPRAISDETMLHYPSLAERSGKLCAVWQVGSYGAGQAVYQNIYSGGSWSGQSAISNSSGCTFCDAAIDASGYSNVVWDAGGEIYYALGSTGGGTSANRAPVADFSFSPTTGIAPLTVSFDASASTDPDGTIASYSWVFGDGSTGSGRTVSHTYQKRGNYSIKLTVIDNLGKPGSTVKTIQILGLYAPLNVAWASYSDQSLFQSRTVNEVTWAYNPANDDVATVTLYRVYRKNVDDDGAYAVLGEVEGTVFSYRDTKPAAGVTYLYAVSSLDAAGHESPLSSDQENSADAVDARDRTAVILRMLRL
ncbi:MAG: PKD domain-containing protein [Acidobacteriota bacterium]|nr:PKD domain-containing protein [Acidobacteriota bacterium]